MSLSAYFANRQMVLQSYVRTDRGSTHWAGCEVSHLNCALSEGADALRKAGELVQVNAALVEALKVALAAMERGLPYVASEEDYVAIAERQARAVLAQVEQ